MAGLLAGRRAFITGGAGGIGRATGRRFCEEGAKVALADLADAEEAAAELRAGGYEAVGLDVDVTSEESVGTAVAAAAEQLGGLDLVVANAGVLSVAPFESVTAEQFEKVLRVNLLGVFLTFSRALPYVREAGSGTLLCTSSEAGLDGKAEMAAYSASKFGVVGLVQSLAKELADTRIRVCGVAPGIVETQMYSDLVAARTETWGADPDAVQDELRADSPGGRPTTPEEVADAFVLLASPLAERLSGVVIEVAGY